MTISGRRALRQALLGLTPLVVIGVVLLVLLSLRLGPARAVIASATASTTALVTATGLDDGRGIDVTFTAADGSDRTGRLTLDSPQDVPLDVRILIAYDPTDPATVYAEGDAATATVDDLVNGLIVVVLVVLVAVAVTVVRVVRRRRLETAPTVTVSVRRERYRRGLTDRTWLVADTGRGPAWFPVYWDHAVESIGEDPTSVLAHGSPTADALVAFEVGTTMLWPSGRRRDSPPKGTQRELPPQTPRVTLLRQVRADGVMVFLAPLMGLLWAYVDGSGPAGFVFATFLSAGVLFWLPSVQGSDPT
ncbi:MAG: hypothetical protein H0T85_10935 [Geodermatophilaceae bacterium]|nr:hypothetical protein [Geodermatophilaceae bacterium]